MIRQHVFCTSCAHFEKRAYFFKPYRCEVYSVKKWKEPPVKPTWCDRYKPKQNEDGKD